MNILPGRWTLHICGLLILASVPAFAAVFGDVRGTVRDRNNGVVTGAVIHLSSRSTQFSRATQTNSAGQFIFRSVPAGEYDLKIEQTGFKTEQRVISVVSDNLLELDLRLDVAPLTQSVDVTAAADESLLNAPRPTTLIDRHAIETTPGADRTNSLAMITANVPGAYVTHNQLHIRGGHQVSWLIDGVPVPNTNIADTVGAQFDPKDMDYLEVQRGGYSASNGDRTFAVFNVVPRSGFERDREAEFILNFGNFRHAEGQFNFGDHTKRFAYYASVTANRSDYGLATPTADVIHDNENGFGAFASLIYDATPRDEMRLVTALRRDFFQVPNDTEAQNSGIRDVESEREGFLNFSWVHTFNSKLVLTVSPFYHYNRAEYIGGEGDTPLIPDSRRSSQYAGAQGSLSILTDHHNANVGFYGFFQHDSTLFRLRGVSNEQEPFDIAQTSEPNGDLEAAFAEDQFKASSWLTLTGGVRFTHFHGLVTENSVSPRIGAAVRIPRLKVVLHGFYGRYYQAPPLSTVSGPLLEFAVEQGFDFIPLRGERDEEFQLGAGTNLKGFDIEADLFRTRISNFFDHNELGSSNIFFPLTIERAFIRGFETTVRSPRLFDRLQLSLVYSHQHAEGQGAVSGGLTDFEPAKGERFFLDHDQRNTLNINFRSDMPWKSYLSGGVRYGSGFLDGEGPDHLPGNATLDLALTKKFGESWSVSLQAVNVFNRRFLVDNSSTFGGTHFSEPRQIYIEVRHRFHF
jgi:outer membrane receptor protein involved in Fe transport